MSREKKKGTSGNAKAFITRARALKKLQLTLPEFRRLCILKGIYPRDPRKKLQGADKTYYLTKDIDFLAHERLIATIRDQNAHKKKLIKARAKRRIDLLKRLALSAPKSRLDHLVVERYPHFADAVRELDDPLCIVALFANLPADHKVGIAPIRVTNCQRLLKEFCHFVAHTNSLRRVFVSVKGYYFQASICGENVTWITPHRFSQVLPADVDYSVMLTFLELYECIMSFVNFRLFTSENLAYPPTILRAADANALELGSLYVKALEPKSNISDHTPTGISDQAVRAAEEAAMVTAEDESDDDPEDHMAADEQADDDDVSGKPVSAVFDGKCIVLGREVPYVELEFALMATGAKKVMREGDLVDRAPLDEYSYWIIDRPNVIGERNMSLEYVQPQYVFDSINAGVLLPTSLYAPDSNLPPHLSPFVTEEDDGGYRPWFEDILGRIKSGDTSVVAEAAAVVYAEGEARAKKDRQVVDKGKLVGESRRSVSPQKRKTSHYANVPTQIPNVAPRTDLAEGETIEPNDVLNDDTKARRKGDERITDSGNGSHVARGEAKDTEDDDEGEDQNRKNEYREQADTEGKEMATLMLSRKKMRQYKRQKREERKQIAVKRKLTEKRKKLDDERSRTVDPKRAKRHKM